VSIKILISRIHTSMCNFCLERSKIGSLKARDMIFVTKSVSTRVREFNGASRKILKSRNHALHDIRIFIDSPLNFSARVIILIIHQVLNPVVGLRYAIIVRVLCQQPYPLSHADYLSGSYCQELFGTMENIKIHRVFDTQCPQGSERPPIPPPS